MDIQLEHIQKRFKDIIVINNLSITFPEGRTSCIMGASGSGKTTLLHILMGLLKQDSGRISGIEDKRISVVFQEDRLIDHWDAVKNVMLVCGKTHTEETIRQHFDRIGLTDYDNKPVMYLSGGMRRRVAIVRALLAVSDLVIMDEPFKGLDERTKQQTMEYVARETKGKTLIIVTHARDEVEKLQANLIMI